MKARRKVGLLFWIVHYATPYDAHMMLRLASLAPRASLALSAVICSASPAAAQDSLGWNSARALELIDRARLRRELPRGDSTLQNYQASATGFVYFYLDRREDDERTLVKVDQIALDLFWKRPNRTKQRIVGLRDVSRLPNRMHYHLDHLTVVQNGFGDVIKIGDGDEVSDVPHPAAPGADTIYDYRLADSVTLQLGGGQPEVRVYQLNVRPKQTNRSALIGSVFVDRANADIVRMTFTFTPVSYVDRRLDYINISLDNGLFGGSYWLPNEQSIEIRRQIPELDFAAGAVIKGRLRVGDYRFNEPLPDSVFQGRPVSAASEEERRNYAFEEEIYAGVNEEGLAPPPQMADLRARAMELVREQRLSGLPPWRLYIPNASSVLRHNRAEGWYAGVGGAYVPSPIFRIDATGGYAFGLEQPEASVAVHHRAPELGIVTSAFYNQPRDIGLVSGMPGVLNTMTSGFGDTDYTDLYFARGVRIALTRPIAPKWEIGMQAAVEKHRAPYSDTAVDLRARPTAQLVNAGDALELGVDVSRTLDPAAGFAWGAAVSVRGIQFSPRESSYPLFGERKQFARGILHVNTRATSANQQRALRTRLIAGHNFGRATAQHFFRIGGRETLPGYRYREFVSESSIALGRAEYVHALAAPWVRLRLLGYAAYTREMHPLVSDEIIEGTTGHVRGSAGAGVGLLWDVLRVDVVKGAHWQTIFSVRSDFWDML
jgi:hypothetical protein